MTDSHVAATVKVGLVQMQCSEDPDENMQKALALTREAIGSGAQVVCLPELFRSRYFCQSEDDANFALAEPIPKDNIMGGAPRGAAVDAITDHTAHHRGALAVYARLADKEPPMPYG